MNEATNEVVNEVTKNDGIFKDIAKYGAGAVIGVGTFVLVRKAAGKISNLRKAKKIEGAEEVNIDTNEYDVEVVDE